MLINVFVSIKIDKERPKYEELVLILTEIN